MNKQCQSITKAGSQCERKPFLGGRYCWQHETELVKWGKGVSITGIVTVIATLIGLVVDSHELKNIIFYPTPTHAITQTALPPATQSPTSIDSDNLIIISKFDTSQSSANIDFAHRIEEQLKEITVSDFDSLYITTIDETVSMTNKQKKLQMLIKRILLFGGGMMISELKFDYIHVCKIIKNVFIMRLERFH